MSDGEPRDFSDPDFLPEINDDTINTVWVDPDTNLSWVCHFHEELQCYVWEPL